MSLVQGLNVLLPLLTFPYLIRVLGFEGFGLINYALALVNFFVVFVDFGYNLTGTRDVAALKNDKQALSIKFSEKWVAQLILFGIATLLFVIVLLSFPKLRSDWLVYTLSFAMVPASLLLPTWFFQGTENFKWLAWLNFINRSLYTIAIFIWIQAPGDVWLVPLFNSSASLLAAFIGLGFIFRSAGIQFIRPSLSQVWRSMKTSSSVFLSSFSVTIYTYSALLILGSFGTDRMVGQFAAIEKILLIFRVGLSTLFAIIFPRVCQLAASSIQAATAFLRKIFSILILLLALAGIALSFLAEPLLELVAGYADGDLLTIMAWMAWIPLLIGLNMSSYQQLLAHHKQNFYTIILVTASLSSVALNFSLAPIFGALGTAWSVLFAESFITLGLLYATEVKYRALSVWRKPG